MGDVRRWDLFQQSRWAWTSLGYEIGFPFGCAFGDIDAYTEFNDWQLFIECKHWHGVGTPPLLHPRHGQARALKRLSQNPNTTTLILLGDAAANNPLYIVNAGTGELYDLRELHIGARRKELKALIDEAMGL